MPRRGYDAERLATSWTRETTMYVPHSPWRPILVRTTRPGPLGPRLVRLETYWPSSPRRAQLIRDRFRLANALTPRSFRRGPFRHPVAIVLAVLPPWVLLVAGLATCLLVVRALAP